MIEKYTIEMLNQDSVSICNETLIDYQGTLYPIGDIWRKAYENHTRGRNEVMAELPQAQQNAIFAVWGDEPTRIESDI